MFGRLIKLIYAIILLIIGIVLFITANTIYGYGSAVISFVAAIYVLFMKKVAKGAIEKIYICSIEKENNINNIVDLKSEEFESIKKIFELQYMVLNLNRDYILDNYYISIKSERRVTDLFYAKDSEGKCVMKSQNKFFEVEVSETELETVFNILEKYAVR